MLHIAIVIIVAAAAVVVFIAGVMLCQIRQEEKKSKGYWN